ncbi:MAG: DNA-processing protein DprA [Zoogloeaceae bacterium]|nr:DNA-processing protein DprA [Zoogloeaceae bacterium]
MSRWETTSVAPDTDHTAWLRLTLVPGVGAASQRALLSAFGPPEQVLSASRTSLSGIVGHETADRLLTGPDPAVLDAALSWLAEPGHHLLTLADAAYPPTLLEIADPPTLLYVIGNPTLLSRPSLAMVGARSATPQGSDNARAFARSLAGSGLCIVSGLALGIDTAAHRGALEADGGTTVAVIGTGADRVYPARNRDLAHRIAAQGAIVSELPLGTQPLAHNFPRRNRIIAGLARGVLVVEAAPDSGSLITARLAGENGREVMAIPGSIHSPLSRGCHRLIREGAKLVETATDVLEELRWNAPAAEVSPARSATPATDPQAAQVLEAMGFDPVTPELLVERCGLTLDALYAILLGLELDGQVASLPGSRFQRL